MKICKKCGQRVDVKVDDYRCMVVRIPFINLNVWRFDFEHSKCSKKNLEIN